MNLEVKISESERDRGVKVFEFILNEARDEAPAKSRNPLLDLAEIVDRWREMPQRRDLLQMPE